MKLWTDQFGEIEIEEKGIVTFPIGIPGFEHLRQFIFLQPDLEIPFSFMQSIEDATLTFIVTNPFAFFPDYVCDLPETVQFELQITTEQDVMIWSVVTIQNSIQDATLNLLAPVVVNKATQLGRQIIINGSKYQTKHKLSTESASIADTTLGQR